MFLRVGYQLGTVQGLPQRWSKIKYGSWCRWDVPSYIWTQFELCRLHVEYWGSQSWDTHHLCLGFHAWLTWQVCSIWEFRLENIHSALNTAAKNTTHIPPTSQHPRWGPRRGSRLLINHTHAFFIQDPYMAKYPTFNSTSSSNHWAIRSYWIQFGRSDMLYSRLQVPIATASRLCIWLLCPSQTTI